MVQAGYCILSGNHRVTEEPDEARVWAKMNAYAKRVTGAILPGPAGVLHVLAVAPSRSTPKVTERNWGSLYPDRCSGFR